MRSFVVGIFSVTVLGGPAALAQVDIRKEPVHFKAGETGATIKGKIKGDETVDYVLNAQRGQSMVVTLEATNTERLLQRDAAGQRRGPLASARPPAAASRGPCPPAATTPCAST